jgi:hypothetical protein
MSFLYLSIIQLDNLSYGQIMKYESMQNIQVHTTGWRLWTRDQCAIKIGIMTIQMIDVQACNPRECDQEIRSKYVVVNNRNTIDTKQLCL